MLKNKKKSLIAALRVTPTNINGDKKKMSPTDVLNTHWEFADNSEDGCVCWSTNVKINAKNVNSIEKVVFFSTEEDWYVEADVVKIVSFNEPTNPDSTDIHDSWLPGEFPEARNTWIVLKNFVQKEREELTYDVVDKDITLAEQVLKPRFIMCYAEK